MTKQLGLGLFLLALILALPASAEGPLFRHKDTFVNQEFDNVYQDMRKKQQSIPVLTKAQLQALTPLVSNQLYICSDCTTTALVISTGTTKGGLGSATSKTTAIN